ncbi:hypothetical protein KY290_000214 [Solanum tuberosum]|uniref:Late embryogenesis abundant protein LEA-2 subgroup domain-containing protein n=1 Tax=Solanum tuberosum TaxID=4113 RepID=A0ABQ7WK57_SOLTU|nr:hypothetical protein KY284_000227 [Solanum tuberosum]KAH0780616.1 hypothetical protein KY290_000214 [Solanum tuberosum]
MHHPAYIEPGPGYPSIQQPYQYYEYNYPARPLPYVSPDIDQGFSFGRVMLCLMLFLFLFAMIISMFTMMVFMTIKPTFYLESFEVRSFDLSGNGGPGTTLKANWETKVSIKNTNTRSSVLVNQVETSLVYRYVALDVSYVDHVEIQKDSNVQILDAFSFPSSKLTFNTDSVVKEMAKDRQRGQIMFDLKLEVQLMVKSNVFHKSEKMRLFCERITLDFKNSTSNIPTWNGNKHECVSGL